MTPTKIGPYLRRQRVREPEVWSECGRLTLERRGKPSFVSELRGALKGVATLGGTGGERRGHGEHGRLRGESNEGNRDIRRVGARRLDAKLPIGPFFLGSENKRNRINVPPPFLAFSTVPYRV